MNNKKYIILIFLLSISLIAFPQAKYGKTISEINKTKKQLSRVNKKSASAYKRLKIINKQIRLKKNLISKLNRDIDNLSVEINNNEQKISDVNIKIKKFKAEYEELIFYAYKTKDVRDKTLYIFESNDFNQAYQRFKYLQFFTDYIENATYNLETYNDSLISLNKNLKSQKQRKIQLSEYRSDEIIGLSNDKDTKKSLLIKLRKKKSILRKQLRAKNKIAKSLSSTVNKQVAKQTIKINDKESLSFKANKRKLPMPASGVIISTFGTHKHPVLENVTIRNDGIEISVSQGSKIKSVFAGKVTNPL